MSSTKYPYAKAVRAAYHLARAASVFSGIRSDYDRVLPDLETAYRIARDWTGASFDPASVARAELAWWVARRTPGEDSAEQVGHQIAEEYAQLYQAPSDCMAPAAALRAEAAHLRDIGGAQADWSKVEALLVQSFRALSTTFASSCGTVSQDPSR